MSLKARLRGAIVALVTAVVVVMSLLYLSDFTKASFSAASDRADLVADQFRIYLENHLTLETAAHGIHPAIAPAVGGHLDRNRPARSRHHRNAEGDAGQSGPGARDSYHRRSGKCPGRDAFDAEHRFGRAFRRRRRYSPDPTALVGGESLGSDDAARKLCVHPAGRARRAASTCCSTSRWSSGRFC